MKKLFEAYMNLPMSVFVVGAIITWSTLASVLLTPAILFYVAAWSVVLVPFLGAIAYTEHKHEMKKLRLAYLRGIKEDLGEN